MRNTLLTLRDPVFAPLDYFAREFERELSSQADASPYLFHEAEDAYLATVDIPGVSFSDISINVEDNTLVIAAERKSSFEKNGEITRKYNYRVRLPKNVDHEKINAHYENGVLSLTLNKLVDTKTNRKIEVLTGPKPKSWTNFLGLNKTEKESVAS